MAQLHVVVALAKLTMGHFAHHGEDLGHQVVQGCAVVDLLLELEVAASQLSLPHALVLVLELVYAIDRGLHALDLALGPCADDLLEHTCDPVEHGANSWQGTRGPQR